MSISHFFPLAYKVANSAWKAGWARAIGELEDVKQEAVVALITVLPKTDFTRPEGVYLSYMISAIRTMLVDQANKKTYPIRFSRHIFREAKGEKGRKDRERDRKLLLAFRENDGGHDPYELPGREEDPLSTSERKEEVDYLLHVLSFFPLKYDLILCMRLGLGGFKEMTIEEIADTLGYSKFTVYGWKREAMSMLMEEYRNERRLI